MESFLHFSSELSVESESQSVSLFGGVFFLLQIPTWSWGSDILGPATFVGAVTFLVGNLFLGGDSFYSDFFHVLTNFWAAFFWGGSNFFKVAIFVCGNLFRVQWLFLFTCRLILGAELGFFRGSDFFFGAATFWENSNFFQVAILWFRPSILFLLCDFFFSQADYFLGQQLF